MTYEEFILIVETNQYAGNFEREMCAFMTGAIGECEVGSSEREQFIEEFGDAQADLFSDLVRNEPDDHGCFRPVSLDNVEADDGFCIYLYEKPDVETLNFLTDRAKAYEHEREGLKVLGIKLIEREVIIKDKVETIWY